MNRLKDEKSPYLLQHAENLVDWYAWSEEAFSKAIREDRPVFLSIGYSTCHWCHVMAHECFEDKEVAEILNREYVSVKVDREERPDVDAVYMAACQAVNGNGGWPLTVIMSPDQTPFFVGTYFPKNSRYGQAGLVEILQRIGALWKNKREELLYAGKQITEFISKPDETIPNIPDKTLLKKAVHLLEQQFDPKWGGFGSAPKFPVPHNLLFLLRYSLLEGDPNAAKMAEHTLFAMEAGGIQDHIGGGFSRYSTDEKWLAPHFEKMLYDNALLILAYAEACQVTHKSHYADTTRRIADYILNELTGKEGEFFCGQDADSEGVEGKYYLFMPEEIIKLLGRDDGKEFCHIYDITEDGNFEGKCIPNRIGKEGKAWNADDLRMRKIYEYRRQRTKLHKDDKVILSWNGWALLAMAKLAQVLGDSKYRDAAVKANQFIINYMEDQRGRLYLRWRENEPAHAGQLDDYAVYGLALLELYRATFEPEYLQQAIFRAGQMAELFEAEQGGYYLTAKDAEQLIARPKETYDGALPSGNAAAAVLLVQLAGYTGELVWQEAADRQIRFLTGAMQNYPLGHSFGLLALLYSLYPSKELICVTREGQLPRPLQEYLQTNLAPNLTLILKTEENAETLGRALPFTKDYPIPEEGTIYYLCQNGMCGKPEEEFGRLKI